MAPKKQGGMGDAPKLLGSVSSLNASLQMFIADSAVARAYSGIDNGEGDEFEGSDWSALLKALENDVDCVSHRIGDGEGLALDLRVGQGEVRVYQRGAELILVESYADEDEELDSIASAKRRERAKPAGKLRIQSGTLIVATSTENCAKAPKQVAPGKAKEFGSDDGSLAVGLEPGTYTLLLEKPDEEERCAFLVRD